MQSWDYDDKSTTAMKKLRDLLQIQSEGELPHIFAYHSTSDTTIKYPDPIVNLEDFSPDLITQWGEYALLRANMRQLKNTIENAKNHPDDEAHKLSDEKMEHFRKLFSKEKEMLKSYKASWLLEKENIKKENKFVEEAREAIRQANEH